MTAAQKELQTMARAFAVAMGRGFAASETDAKVGDWYIARADTQKPLYRLAEYGAHGSNSYPITASAFSAQGLADALYVARIAVGMERTSRSAHELGYPYRGAES